MSPEMRLRISAQNDTARGFAEVKRDAVTAAASIEASGRRAGASMARTSALAMNNSRQLSYQLIDMGQAIPLAFQSPIHGLQNMGFQIAQIGQLYMGQGGMKQALVDAVGQVGRFAVKLGPLALAAGVVTAGFAGLTHEINKTAATQVSFGDVFMASMQLAAESIGSLLAPAIGQIGTWLAQTWDFIFPSLKAVGNGIIATFLGAFDAVKIAWGALPAVMGDVAFSTANAVVGGVEFMVNGAIGLLNDLISLANNVPGVDLQTMGRVGFGGIGNPYEGAGAGLGRDVAGAFTGAFGNDYVGGAIDAISGRAQELALAKDAIEDVGGAAKGAEKGLGDLAKQTNVFADAAKSAFNNMGTGLIEAFRKGGDVALNILDMVMGKVGQLGETLLNNGLNGLLDMGLNAVFGALGGGFSSQLGRGLTGGNVFGGSGGVYGLPSFDGGGWTGNGPRVGGVDGKGGFRAILHPRERVVDQTSSGNDNGQATRIVIELGAGLEGRILQQAGQQAVQIVQSTVPRMIDSQAPAAMTRAQRNKVA